MRETPIGVFSHVGLFFIPYPESQAFEAAVLSSSLSISGTHNNLRELIVSFETRRSGRVHSLHLPRAAHTLLNE